MSNRIRWYLGFKQCVKLFEDSRGWGFEVNRLNWVSGDDVELRVRLSKVVLEVTMSFPRFLSGLNESNSTLAI